MKTPAFHNPCPHPENKTRRGVIYDYCEGCGATRKRAQAGKKQEPWHSCALCILPGVVKVAS